MKKRASAAGLFLALLACTFSGYAQQQGNFQPEPRDSIGYDQLPKLPDLQPVGEAEVETAEFRLYPNPCKEILRVEASEKMETELLIYSLAGNLVHRQQMLGDVASVAVGSLPRGVYLLRLGKSTHRFVKE